MKSKASPFLERVLARVTEALLIYVCLGGVISIGVVAALVGHFPPTKLDFKEQFEKMRGMMEKSEQVLVGLQKTNQELAALGPQLQTLDKTLTDIYQRVQALEIEVAKIKAEKGQH